MHLGGGLAHHAEQKEGHRELPRGRTNAHEVGGEDGVLCG